MAEQPIAPIIPNMSNQQEAVAGSSAAIFTATDRKLIKEIAGELDPTRSFREVFSQKPLTPEVENEETTVKPEPDVRELDDRTQEHQQMLKHSTLYVPRERVEISNKPPDSYEEPKKIKTEASSDDKTSSNKKEKKTVHEETAAMVKELNLNPSEIIDKFALEQKQLYGLISRIKELHLKRLLTDKQKEFDKFSKEIEKETLAAAKAESQIWLKAQLAKLTRDAAEYKLGILKSLQAMNLCPQREKSIKWLRKLCGPEV